MDHSNIKIVKNSATSFTLTAGDGTIYQFNNIVEKTRDVKTNGNPRAHKIKTTAWFLTDIISPQGDQVHFGYSPIYTQTKLGPNQSVILKTLAVNYPYNSNASCAGLCQGQWSPVQYNKVDYDTYYLSSISTSNGQQVYFVYADRPDAGGDNRLMYVNVYTTNDAPVAKLIKKYLFEYQDYTVSNDLNQRFFLTKLYTYSTGSEIPPEVLLHQFEYNDPSTLGSQESLNQDYYGYARGSTVLTGNFFPRPGDYASYENGSLGIDRSPNFEATKAGTLKKVIYPTGGYQDFVYEPHTVVEYSYNTHTDTTWNGYMSMSGIGLNYSSTNTYTQLLTVTSPQTRISYTTEWNAASGPAPGSPQYWTPDDIHFISYLEIWKVSTNTKIFEDRHKVYQTTLSYPVLETGIQYEVRLKVVGNSHRSYLSIYYNPTVQTSNSAVGSNVTGCGIRVQKINAFDPVTNKTNTKYYTYTALQNLGLTSGVGSVSPSFTAGYQGGGICYDPVFGYELLFECPGGLLQVSSSSLSGAYTFSGSPVAYANVIESDDPLFANGGIEHQFYTYFNPQQPLTIIGQQIAGASSAGAFPDRNGTELLTTVFKRQGTNNIVLKTTSNVYSDDNNYTGATLTNYVTRKRWTPSGASNFSYTQKLSGFDVNGYIYISKWRHLDAVVTTQYDKDGTNPMTNTVTYSYNNTVHLQPTQVSNTSSTGENIVQQLKYPHDFADAVSTGMISKNIIQPVIETSTMNNSTLVSTVHNDYVGLESNSFYKPQLVKVKKGSNALETRLHYYSFDNRGNPLDLSKEDGMHISYLWNYQKTYTVAEVKNALPDEIAYTSFEGDDLGKWSYNPAGLQATGITGDKSFTGTLSFTLKNTAPYIITLWSQTTNPAVNSAAGQLLITRNGWNLYKWTVSGVSSVTVTGTIIDEVRLYPSGAQMTTYTYLPFIGISTVCDANNSILRYTYDGFSRLLLVRDLDNNILKQYEYKYNQAIAPCGNTTANWVATGTLSCVIASNGNLTGEQKSLERDMSTCSLTYLQTRWVSLGVTGQCAPINCTGADKRVVNGVCETGTRVFISSSYSGGQWRCMFKYVWSDGYEGHAFFVYQSQPCVMPED